MFMVHVVVGVVIAIVARVGIVRMRRVVAVRVGRIGQRSVTAVAVPGARAAVRRRAAVLAVVAAIHGACPTRLQAHPQAATSDILALARTATSPHSYAQRPYHYSTKISKFMTLSPLFQQNKNNFTSNRRPLNYKLANKVFL